MILDYKVFFKVASGSLLLLLIELCYANESIDIEISGLKLADENSYSKTLKLLDMETNKRTHGLEKICNKSNSEIAKFSFFEGGSYGQVMQIEVAKASNKDCKADKVGSIPVERLTTNNGISIGQTYEVVASKLRIKESSSRRAINLKIIHSESKFLQEKNMPEYVAKYIFNHDRTLISFSFGFTYP